MDPLSVISHSLWVSRPPDFKFSFFLNLMFQDIDYASLQSSLNVIKWNFTFTDLESSKRIAGDRKRSKFQFNHFVYLNQFFDYWNQFFIYLNQFFVYLNQFFVYFNQFFIYFKQLFVSFKQISFIWFKW